MAQRLQMPRTGQIPKGWRMAAGGVKITRPAKWCNPYRLTEHGGTYSREEAVDLFERDLIAGTLVTKSGRAPLGVPDAVRDLAGRDLYCVCEPTERCHGDVLIHWANTAGRRS